VPSTTRKEVELLEGQAEIRNTAQEHVAMIDQVTCWTTHKLVEREMFECSSGFLGEYNFSNGMSRIFKSFRNELPRKTHAFSILLRNDPYD
jgi:hypothetical protein